MPDNWIGNIKITDETEVLDSTGTKIHDYISCDQGAGVYLDPLLYPKLSEHGVLLPGDTTLADASTSPDGFCSSVQGDIVYVRVSDNTYNETQRLFKSTDSGETFTQIDSGTSGWNHGVCCSSDGLVVYWSVKQAVRASFDGGSTWTTYTTSQDTKGVCCSSDGTKLIYFNSTNFHSYKWVGSWSRFNGNITSNTHNITSAEDDATYLIFSSERELRRMDWDSGATSLVHIFPTNIRGVIKSEGVIQVLTTENTVYSSSDYFVTVSTESYNTAVYTTASTPQGPLQTASGRLFSNTLTKLFEVPDIPTATGSPWPYKIVADKT